MTSRMAKIIFNNPFFRVLSRFFGIIRDCSPPPLFATLHVGSQYFLQHGTLFSVLQSIIHEEKNRCIRSGTKRIPRR